ncbi:hypothetical protein [Curtobacterium pusillum]|uniref:hypothetical protein n=1 Tax=Curtobacterium pusillum TaxID=69373 RepID=UPI0011A7E5FB|nr:hypothetical protein [Curtobacterium pusillum]
MRNDQPDEAAAQEHDPYARRPGYVTDVSGRTDSTTTAAALGVAAGLVATFVFGLVHLVQWIALPAALVVGVAVWLLLRTRQRRIDRNAGRSPDAVPRARDQAAAEANGGRRHFVAPNPVVLIVMASVFIAFAVVSLVFGRIAVTGLLVPILLVGSAAFFLVEGIGTLVVRRRASAGR